MVNDPRPAVVLVPREWPVRSPRQRRREPGSPAAEGRVSGAGGHRGQAQHVFPASALGLNWAGRLAGPHALLQARRGALTHGRGSRRDVTGAIGGAGCWGLAPSPATPQIQGHVYSPGIHRPEITLPPGQAPQR